MIKETSLALNTRNWLPKYGETVEEAKKRTVNDFTAASLEQREAPLEERINTYIYVLDQNSQLCDKESGKRPTLRWETETDHLENTAFEAMEDWAAKDSSGNLAWFSPPSNRHRYTEARLVVLEKEATEKEILIVCRAFCLPHSENECLYIAKEIAKTSDQNTVNINAGDILRATPVSFNPPSNITWYEYLEKQISEPKIWEKVKNGNDLRNKEEAILVSEPVVEKYFDLITAAKNAHEYVLVGALMEREMARSGIIFQARGSCGISNQEALQSLRGNKGIFDTVFTNSATANYEASFNCPKCHHSIPSGYGITVCPHCGARKEDYGKCA